MKTPIQSLRTYLEDDLKQAQLNNKIDKVRYIKEIIDVINLKFINDEKMIIMHSYEAGLVNPKYPHGLAYFYKVYDEKLTMVL